MARRREYCRQWRATEAGKDYHKKWNAEHKDSIRERSRAYKKRWREHNKDLLRAQWARRRERIRGRIAEIPALFTGHDFFDTARFICGDLPNYWPKVSIWEEEMAEVVLALVEGRDPEEAFRIARAKEYGWSRFAGPIYDNVDISDSRKVVFVSPYD